MSVELPSASRPETHEMPTAQPKYQCPICSKCYKRREHLFRHTSSHTSERPYRCNSCDGAFQRADVLKRHGRACNGGSSRSGARRRACDRCVRQKKACSSHQPCRGCSKKGVACFYSSSSELGESAEHTELVGPSRGARDSFGSTAGLSSFNMTMPFGITTADLEAFATSPSSGPFSATTIEPSGSIWQDNCALASGSQVLRGNPLLDTGTHHSLHFLDRFTSKTGLVLTFDCGTQEQREQVASALESETFTPAQQPAITSQSSMSGLQLDIVSPPLLENISDSGTEDCIPLNWLNDPLSLKTHEILLLIEEVVTVKPRNSAVTLDWSSALKNACLQFFSPTNLRRLLGMFWAIWHPNVNFVHRPSFDPVSAKPALLAAMALIGACVSPDLPDNEDARMWFNCVEEMVFIDDDFNSDLDYPSTNSIAVHRRKIQILQAAYIVCLYQNWEGTDSSKGRIRRYRFATLVSSARDIGITTATHLNYAGFGRHEFEWREYAAREELIRLFTWIFLLDTAFVIFNNLPPRLVIKEMRMHMATPETCFQAVSADECHQQIQLHLPAGSIYWSLSFRGAFESLSKDTLTPGMCQTIADLGPLNLFALASAIHSQIFQYRSSVSTAQNLKPIRNTLSNWRDAWQAFASISSAGLSPHITVNDTQIRPENMWRRIGFCRYCPEYWLLANLMADRLATLGALQQGNGMTTVDEGPLDPILDQYDQTSMQQVNDLIMGFQMFQI